MCRIASRRAFRPVAKKIRDQLDVGRGRDGKLQHMADMAGQREVAKHEQQNHYIS